MSGIIADSLTWKEYLEKGNTKEAEILEKLIKEDKVIVCGYTFAEILKDIQGKEIFENVKSRYVVKQIWFKSRILWV